MRIITFEDALKFIRSKFDNGKKSTLTTHYTNNRKNCIITFHGKSYFVVFKHFKVDEPAIKKNISVGLFQKPLSLAINSGSNYLLFIFSNCKMFKIEPNRFQDYAVRHNYLQKMVVEGTKFLCPLSEMEMVEDGL